MRTRVRHRRSRGTCACPISLFWRTKSRTYADPGYSGGWSSSSQRFVKELECPDPLFRTVLLVDRRDPDPATRLRTPSGLRDQRHLDAPAALQALRVFRLLRLLRVARGFQLLSKLLTLDGLKYVMALAVFLVVGGGTVFASVESHVGHQVSTWDGIWWAMGTVTTEGSNIEVTTNAGRAIAIILMLTGIGVFSIMTGAIAQHFLSSSRVDDTEELSHGEKAIMTRLDEISTRLAGIEMARSSGTADAEPNSSHG
jgi:hypothetical protein